MFVLMDIKLLDIYRGFRKMLDIYSGFRKRSIFTVVFENVQFSRYVKPFLLDVYRRFETYAEKSPPKKVVTRKRFLYVRPLFARYLPQTSIRTFRCNNSFFYVFLSIFCISSVCATLFDPGGSQKSRLLDTWRISTRVLVRMICPCFIEQIWVYILF